MNMNQKLGERVMELEAERRKNHYEREMLAKENGYDWNELYFMARGYFDYQWEKKLNAEGRYYDDETKTFRDKTEAEMNVEDIRSIFGPNGFYDRT